MKLSQLIAHLEQIQKQQGDVEVYTNGEHGFNDTELLTVDAVSVGEAQAELPDDFGTKNDTIVVHIGGY